MDPGGPIVSGGGGAGPQPPAPPPIQGQGHTPPPPPTDGGALGVQLVVPPPGGKGGGKRKRAEGEEGLIEEDTVLGRIQEYGLKQGPGNSVIWDYFEKYNVANDNPLRSIGVCKLCRQQEDYTKAESKMGKDLSTGNLKSHLQHNHRVEFQEFLLKAAQRAAAKSASKGITPLGAGSGVKQASAMAPGGQPGAAGGQEVGEARKKLKRGRGPAGARLFLIMRENVLEVLQDLQQLRDLVRQFQDTSVQSGLQLVLAESYREWSADKAFKEVSLASPGAYASMKTFLVQKLNAWLEEQLRAQQSDLQMKALKDLVSTEIENIYFKAAKMRAHLSRLPKELQKRMKLGIVKSFEQIFDFIATSEAVE